MLMTFCPTCGCDPCVNPDFCRACSRVGEVAMTDAGDPFTEDALALRFSKRHANDLRYVALKAQWFKWDGHRWQPEPTLLAFDLARKSCRADVQVFGNGKPPAGVSSAKTVAAVERMARADRRQAAMIEQFDVEDFAFTTGEGEH